MSRIREEPPIGTIGEKVELFQDCLPDEYFVPENQCFVRRISAENFKD